MKEETLQLIPQKTVREMVTVTCQQIGQTARNQCILETYTLLRLNNKETGTLNLPITSKKKSN